MICFALRRSKITLLAASVIFMFPLAAYAGGPRLVAGTSYFDPDVKGAPVLWAQGAISYYTDQGDLSPQLPGPAADAFVGESFSRWTSIPTAAIAAVRSGQLGEDVNGSNVTASPDGTIHLPSDILPNSTAEPVAIIYDADGAVTDALLGQGASTASDCRTNAVFGGADGLSTDGHIVHALVILNGNCAQSQAQLPDLQYQLVRVLGEVIGLGWSQANLNVITSSPSPTSADYSGFPLMHAVDPIGCAPIAICYPAAVDPTQPKLDDQAALSRLYPVTAQNAGGFPGKIPLSANSVRIHGSVYFMDDSGQPAQAMQGVNVVARWVDPATGLPSRTYVVTCVSGFLFRGNAGNPITGIADAEGQRFDRFGSDDPAVEGFFDLSGLPIPDGSGTAQYELTVEPVDPIWSKGMGPYGSMQVEPSGATRVFVYANLGQDVQQDLVLQGSAVAPPDWFGSTSYLAPVPVPSAGDWTGSLSPYGDADYFSLPAQANRTLSVSVTALDESGNPSENKARPVIGMWTLADTGSSPAPANTPSAFNTFVAGESRLDAQLNATSNFRIGFADLRGDGRPDFRYHAQVLYGDKLTPSRASVAGGTPLAIQGLGFNSRTTSTFASVAAPLLAVTPNQILAIAPALPDGVKNVVLSNPANGGGSTMFAALTYGAGPNDTLRLISGSNPPTPLGGEAEDPVVVRVLAPDGVTPVAGASVLFTSSPSASLAACGGAASCSVLSDQSGYASTRVTVLTLGATAVVAELAPASYNPPKTVQATVSGVSNGTAGPDIALAPQQVWIAQGATVSVPITARALQNGVAQAGITVKFRVENGSGVLTPSSAVTAASGYAASTLQVPASSGDIEVSACLEPGDKPCLTLSGVSVASDALQVQPVTGTLQILPVGENFQPVTARVTDASGNPVLGASVLFQWLVARIPQNLPIVWIGDTGVSTNPMPVVLSSGQAAVQSDMDGLAAMQPSSGGAQGSIVILGNAAAGNASLLFQLQSLPPLAGNSAPSAIETPVSHLRRDPRAR